MIETKKMVRYFNIVRIVIVGCDKPAGWPYKWKFGKLNGWNQDEKKNNTNWNDGKLIRLIIIRRVRTT